MPKKIIIFLTFLSFNLSAIAQEVGFNIDFLGYADNREYKLPYTTPKTIFGTRISPDLYFQVGPNHKLHGGVHIGQDFGEKEQNNPTVRPIIYYNYQDSNFDFSIGHIPRYDLMKNTPRALLSDTMLYYRPNIEGMVLAYKNNMLNQKLFIDWTSKQSDKDREQFFVGLNGKIKWGSFYFSDDIIMWHNALSSNDSIEQHIQDNGTAMFKFGADLSRKTILDSLTVDAGILIGMDRIRSEYEFRFPKGFIANIYMAYRKFSLENTFYSGQSQNTPYADSYYRSKTYNRLDLGWSPFKSANIEGIFKLALHFTPGQIANQQTFTLRYLFTKSILKR
ncbi:hypothetical protein [Sphingobacterium sp. SYP-B4668]|uniref:hypothetical protein n=1 Tax=Sphingobacterium sp. SYP-B4668 TaxID=2996035 RepID=UPI00053235AC|nr:hypothetical protein [Sphingobacterium sp. SYP-B4668]